LAGSSLLAFLSSLGLIPDGVLEAFLLIIPSDFEVGDIASCT
jgi:hypothetical protein